MSRGDDTHLDLARSESRETRLVCGTCGKCAEGNYGDADGHVCNACIYADDPVTPVRVTADTRQTAPPYHKFVVKEGGCVLACVWRDGTGPRPQGHYPDKARARAAYAREWRACRQPDERWYIVPCDGPTWRGVTWIVGGAFNECTFYSPDGTRAWVPVDLALCTEL